jgi:hypothetical protein
MQLGRASRGEQKICLGQTSRRDALDVQKWKATGCTMDLHERRNAALVNFERMTISSEQKTVKAQGF